MVGRDTDNEEGTGELAKAKDRESRGLNVENASTSKQRLQGRGSGNETRQGEHRDRRVRQSQGQGIAGPDVENATHVRAETPGTGKRERNAARRAPENTCVQQRRQDSSRQRKRTAATQATGPASSGGTPRTGTPATGPGQSWLFPADFWPILGYFGLFKTKSWLIPVDISSYRHSLSVSAGDKGGTRNSSTEEQGAGLCEKV